MLERAFAAGVPASWVVGDSVYGDARRLRLWLETQERAYVLAVSSKEYVWLGGMQRSVKSVLEGLDEEAWQRLSAGSGSKGPRALRLAVCEVDGAGRSGLVPLLAGTSQLASGQEIDGLRGVCPVTDGVGDPGVSGGPALVHRDVFRGGQG